MFFFVVTIGAQNTRKGMGKEVKNLHLRVLGYVAYVHISDKERNKVYHLRKKKK